MPASAPTLWSSLSRCVSNVKKEKRERQTDRQTDRQTYRQTETETETERQTDRDREREGESFCNNFAQSVFATLHETTRNTPNLFATFSISHACTEAEQGVSKWFVTMDTNRISQQYRYLHYLLTGLRKGKITCVLKPSPALSHTMVMSLYLIIFKQLPFEWEHRFSRAVRIMTNDIKGTGQSTSIQNWKVSLIF